jgi:hypothetical protein
MLGMKVTLWFASSIFKDSFLASYFPHSYLFLILLSMYFISTNVVADGRSRVQLSAWIPAILTEGFRGFAQLLQENSGIGPKIRPRSLLSTSSPICQSLITLTSIQDCIVTTAL